MGCLIKLRQDRSVLLIARENRHCLLWRVYYSILVRAVKLRASPVIETARALWVFLFGLNILFVLFLFRCLTFLSNLIVFPAHTPVCITETLFQCLRPPIKVISSKDQNPPPPPPPPPPFPKIDLRWKKVHQHEQT